MGIYNPYSLPPIRPHYRGILKKHFTFYNQLPAKSKKLFEKRVQYFIHLKKFIARGRGVDYVTEEMKVLVAASAVQITFGLPKVFLKNFHSILIFGDTYYSKISHNYHKGEVNPRRGLIVLSWKYFVDGYLDKSDGINLGLHEMAHALHIENGIWNGEWGFLHRPALRKWEKIAKTEMEKAKTGESILRAYAGTNSYEFFACAVEVFFEKPFELKGYSLEMYDLLSGILNQNPIELAKAT